MGDIPPPKLRIRFHRETQWQCDHCGAEFNTHPKWKFQLAGEVEHPDIFDRKLEFCIPCAKLVGEKLRQMALALESESKEGNGNVSHRNTDSDTDGIQYRRALESESGESQKATQADLYDGQGGAPKSDVA